MTSTNPSEPSNSLLYIVGALLCGILSKLCFHFQGSWGLLAKHENLVNGYGTTSQILLQNLMSVTDLVCVFRINTLILCFYWHSLFKRTAEFWIWVTGGMELLFTKMGKTVRVGLEGNWGFILPMLHWR